MTYRIIKEKNYLSVGEFGFGHSNILIFFPHIKMPTFKINAKSIVMHHTYTVSTRRTCAVPSFVELQLAHDYLYIYSTGA
jgi:hypothetical protein